MHTCAQTFYDNIFYIMADLNPLIRVRKHTVEQKQKFLSQLYKQAEELTTQKETLQKEREEEQKKVKEMGVAMLSYFGPYNDAVKARIKEIDEHLKTLETRIEIAREDMRAAFADLKKIEITQQRRSDEEEKEIASKEASELDDIALDIYRRQQEEEG